MLDSNTLSAFIKKANQAHQQLCVWFAANNEFAKHQTRWNERKHGCKYKNFWSVVVPTLQHGWVLSTARLLDPAYHPRDREKEKPRISLDYILTKLGDDNLSNEIRDEIEAHLSVINSLIDHRDNFHAHNDANFTNTRIEAGVENLFQWLEDTISKIKEAHPHLNNCGIINIEYNEELSQCGVDEIFEALLNNENYSNIG